jgi:hypothetical protein
MSRTVTIVLVLLAMFWQAAPMARADAMPDGSLDLAHAALHWQQSAHHHDEDGSVRLDDSTESFRHLIADLVGGSPALAHAAAIVFVKFGGSPPAMPGRVYVPDPCLEVPTRPPRPAT